MHLTANKSSLENAIRDVAWATGNGRNLPILSCVVIENGTVRGCDLEAHARTKFECTGEGKWAIPATILTNALKMMPEGDVELSGDATVRVVSGAIDYKFAGMNPDDAPDWPKSEMAAKVVIAQADLKNAIDLAGRAVLENDPRRALRGVLLKVEDGGARFTGSNGNILISIMSPVVEEVGCGDNSVIIPASFINGLSNVLGNGEATIEFSSSKIRVALGGSEYFSTCIDAPFFNWRNIIQPNFQNSISVDRAELFQWVKRAVIVGDDKYRAVEFHFSKGFLNLKSSNANSGEFAGRMDIAYEGRPASVRFDSRIALTILSLMKGDVVTLKFSPNVAAVFEAECDPGSIFLGMPLMDGKAGVKDEAEEV